MAITLEQRTDLITALVGLFDAAPSSELLTGFVAGMSSGTTVDSMVNNWTASAEFQAVYPSILTSEEFSTNFVKNLLGNNVDADTMISASDFILEQINSGLTHGQAALVGIRALAAVDSTDSRFGLAHDQLLNKVDVATYFALNKDIKGATFDQLRAVTAGVDATSSSVNSKKQMIDATDGLSLKVSEQRLTTDVDLLTGTAGMDVFKALFINNENTFQSGDEIKGGAGNDTLDAYIGDSQSFAILANTDSVETAIFRVQAQAGNDQATDGTDNDNSDNDVDASGDTNVNVDAGEMIGTTAFWSTNSRADLSIEDIQTNSHLTTIGFRNGDQGDTDYSVYFDHVTAPDGTTAGSQLFLEILDLEAAADTGEKLTNNPYAGVQLKVGDQTVEIRGASPVKTTYAELVAGLNASLVAQGFTTVTASLGEEFKKFNADDGLQYSGTQIVLTNTGSEALTGIGWIADGVVPADSNVHTAINDVAPSTTNALTQTNIIFDNVGQTSQGGDFLAGNMSSSGASGSHGIQQFNVTVEDTSWLKTVSTTTNDLEKVVVVNSASTAAAGDLRIGAKDGSAGLVDVQTFDASAMAGKVTLQASLGLGSETLIAKYDDLDDTQTGAANDNVTFSYKTGSADDVLELDISEEAIAYEDLVLTIETGAGNDTVEFEVKDSTANLSTNWDEDQAALNNITISTGAGDDVVRTLGDGEVTITTGTGDDTVYSDNSGLATEAATWVFNAINAEFTDLQGNGAGTDFFLLNGKVTVTFSAGSTGGGVSVADASPSDVGFESTVSLDLADYKGNQSDINQGIKAAINNDATLSKLLVATDGPNHSLIVTSLVDGLYNVGDLDVAISQDNFPATVTSDVQDAYEAFMGNSTVTYDNTAHTNNLTTAKTSGIGYNNDVVFAQNVGTPTFTLTFGAGATEVGNDTTVTFDGVTFNYDLTAGANSDGPYGGPHDWADEFADEYNDAGTGNWTATTNHSNTVTFTSKNSSATSIALSDFVFGGNTANDTNAALVLANTTVMTDYDGVSSNQNANDNTINLGSGSDVLVLSTHLESNETVVFTGLNQGNVDIFNFTVTGTGVDVLDFSAHLNTKAYASGSTSLASQSRVATTLNTNGVAEANSVTVIDFVEGSGATASQTFSALTAADLLKALNDTAVASNYGDLTEIDLDAQAATTSQVGDTRDYVVMIHNEANDGEYKVFYLTSSDAAQTGTTSGDFATAELIGTVDIGEDAAFSAGNFGGIAVP